MRRAGGIVLSCCLLVAVTACQVHAPSLSGDGPERSCTPPKLTVVGHAPKHRPLTVRPGQTLRLHGVHFTDDCQVAGAGQGTTISRVQLVLRSTGRIGQVAIAHPHGLASAFTVSVTIPSTTLAGPARIGDAGGLKGTVLRLVVRR
jgi:hypothetical protein